MLITRSVLVQEGSMKAQMEGISGGFYNIYAFLRICSTFFIQSKISLFRGQNLGQICHRLRELLDQLPLTS